MSERKIIEWAFPLVKEYRTYVDVGANDGDTSIPFIDKFKKIIAFEPNPLTYKLLKQHDQIESYNCALGSYNGNIKLISPFFDKPVWGSTSPLRYNQWQNAIEYEVDVKTLDSFALDDVDFIKIDVEQAEMDVILGAVETITKNKPVIMFENKRNENQCVVDYLTDLGFNIQKYKSDTVAYHKDNK